MKLNKSNHLNTGRLDLKEVDLQAMLLQEKRTEHTRFFRGGIRL